MAESKQRIHKQSELNIEFENVYRAFNQILQRISALESAVVSNKEEGISSINVLQESIESLQEEVVEIKEAIEGYHP